MLFTDLVQPISFCVCSCTADHIHSQSDFWHNDCRKVGQRHSTEIGFFLPSECGLSMMQTFLTQQLKLLTNTNLFRGSCFFCVKSALISRQ